VDFLETAHDGSECLIQVCADLSEETTRTRELQELEFARRERPGASGLLLCAEKPPPEAKFPQGLRVETLWKWLGRPRDSRHV